MTYAYRCPVAGLEFAEGPGRMRCPVCGKTHLAYEAGAPEPELGCPNMRNDHLRPHFDFSAGAKFKSKSEREAYCKRNGLVVRSYDEHLRNTPHNHSKPRAMSYRGQRSRRSSAEKRGTIDGHAVL